MLTSRPSLLTKGWANLLLRSQKTLQPKLRHNPTPLISETRLTGNRQSPSRLTWVM